MMISIFISAWKEEKQIKKVVNSIVNPEWNNYKGNFELLIVCPDEATWIGAKEKADEQDFENIRWIKDPGKGKPLGLKMAFKEAKGDIFILTDGDVYFDKNAVSNLVKHFEDKQVGGVTGRPVSIDPKDNFMGYMGHMLADVAHHKRLVTMRSDVKGHSLKIVTKEPGFFVLSGYILAMRNVGIEPPEDCLIEDAYFSYVLHNKGYGLVYEPEAKVFVKYAKHLSDWFKQKLRSVGGYVQLWKYDVIKPETKVRDFWKELQYFWFPIKYAKSLKEFIWSLFVYPIRAYLWLRIFIQRKILKKSFEETWVRIESTK